MNIGIIGAGAIAQALAVRMTAAGIDDIVLSNSRGPATLTALTRRLGASVRAGTVADAAAADLTVLAVPWSRIPGALGQVQNWSGRILIDATNPIEAPAFRQADLDGRTSSEVVADLAPGAHLVKGFNHLAPDLLAADPAHAGGRRVLFYSGDDTDTKHRFANLARRLGFEPIDLGPLATGGALHQFPGGPLPVRNLIQL